MKVLIKKHIKNEDENDLPPKGIECIIHKRDTGRNIPGFCICHQPKYWIDNGVDYYLEEVKLADLIELPTEDEILAFADFHSSFRGVGGIKNNNIAKQVSFAQGMRLAIEQIKNRNGL